MSKVVEYKEVGLEMSERLSRMAKTEFTHVGAAGGVRYWYDELEDVFYIEYTCNGPSSWGKQK